MRSIAEQVRDAFLCKLKPSASARGVLQDERDARGLAQDEPERLNRTGDLNAPALAPGADASHHWQHGQEHPDPGDVGEPEQEAADQQRHAGCHESAASGGEYALAAGPGPVHVWVTVLDL